jgi:hypothetical protein
MALERMKVLVKYTILVSHQKQTNVPMLILNGTFLGRNCLLISAIYECDSCRAGYKAHDEELIIQISDDISPPFLLFHRSGVTMKLYDLIISAVEKGKQADFV